MRSMLAEIPFNCHLYYNIFLYYKPRLVCDLDNVTSKNTMLLPRHNKVKIDSGIYSVLM